MTDEHTEAAKTLLDLASYLIALGVLVDALPTVAAGLSVIWLCIQISQSQRFAEFIGFCGRVWRWLTGQGGTS